MLERSRILLPRWRGAAPIQWSILSGDEETGVGVMAMEEGLDTGPVLLERKLTIGLQDNAHVLGERLSRMTADLMVEALPLIEAAGSGSTNERWQRLGLRPQAEKSCYARMLTKKDFQIDWTDSALAIHRKVMGLYPGAQTSWNGKRLKLIQTEPLIERLKDRLSQEAQDLLGRWPLEVTLVAPFWPASGPVRGEQFRLSGIDPRGATRGKGRSRGQALVQQLAAAEHQRLGSS